MTKSESSRSADKNRPNPLRTPGRQILWSAVLASIMATGGCGSSGSQAPQQTDGGSSDGNTGDTNGSNASGQATAGETTGNSDGEYSLLPFANPVNLEEGTEIDVPILIRRIADHQRSITLKASLQKSSISDRTTLVFDATELIGETNQTNLSVRLLADRMKITASQVNLVVTASDGLTQASATLKLNVTPTSKPDIYLLIGQSNMVGFSELNAKDAIDGGLDIPDERIRQLNVTANDTTNFRSPADFVVSEQQVAFPDFVIAEDPLHSSRALSMSGKAGTRIGLGLSFAKRALQQNPASDIILVPAAWSTTGFCSTGEFLGQNPAAPQWIVDGELGWNAFEQSDPAFGGTTLFKRAVLRANITIQRSGGILRGILWHQGESDAENPICANAYAANLATLAGELRTQIIQDARGPSARGAGSDVPFIVGTMSRGIDERGDYSTLSDSKQTIDTTHRIIATQPLISYSDVALFDDLVPANGFRCGEGACVHFGAAAYREMGVRYFDAFARVMARP